MLRLYNPQQSVVALAPGVHLGQYEILSLLGAGGMGEVYRAHDTSLGRHVAIKILPRTFADDPERLARFEREARTLAALNHPNIAHVYGFERIAGAPALVMELVEGPTLADLIEQKRAAPGDEAFGTAGARDPHRAAETGTRGMPVDEALQIARQLAEALGAAHEHGIIHRDLKPANVKVRDDGTVKVLDFGLAKALEPAGVPAGGAQSPTITTPAMTQAGIILGTAAYMSPEQAAGQAADRRSDLWAFGAVLAEMLTGRPAFTGETVSHVLAAVLKSDPDLAALPPDTPRPIRRLLHRCLEKDRRRRLDSAAAARLDIEEALRDAGQEPVVVPTPRRSLMAIVAAALATGAIIAAITIWIVMPRGAAVPGITSRFAVTPPATQPLQIGQFENNLAVAPDGRQFVYASRYQDTAARGVGTGGTLMLRKLDQLGARPAVPFGRSPFFSPDGAWIGYFDDNDNILKKMPVSGTTPVPVCRFIGGPRGASWGEDNTIVFATGDPATGLWRVPAAGGEPTILTNPDAAQPLGDHLFPSVLPGGRGILFTIAEPGRPDEAQVAVLDSATGQPRMLIRRGSQAHYLASGHLVYAAAGTLRAVRFDLDTLQVLGEPVPVVEDVMMTSVGAAFYGVSKQGTLVYLSGHALPHPLRSLIWVDRQGRQQPLKAPIRAYASARLSPDGTRVALDIRDGENDIWIWNLAGETIRKVTHGPALEQYPVWTPDSRHVIFTSNRAGPTNLYIQAADGSGRVTRLTTSHKAQFPTAVASDGRAILGHEFGDTTSFDLFLFRFETAVDEPPDRGLPPVPAGPDVQPLVQDPLGQTLPVLSPDGRYMAYQSNESGRFEIYISPFPDVNRGKWQLTTAVATRAGWGGRELFYYDHLQQALVAVPVETSGTTFAWGNPVRLFDVAPFDAAIHLRSYDVAPDGRRFLMLRDQPASPSATESPEIVVVLNWFEELKAKLPVSR